MSSRFWLAFAVLVALGPEPARADPALDVVTVKPDQAKLINLPPGTATVIVGNPTFADLTLMNNNKQAVITAHAYGETNMIAVSADGRVLEEKELRVLPAKTVVVLQNGTSRVSYACNPDCMPTVQLGDDNDVFSKAGTQITLRDSLAHGASATLSGAGK
jgi:hypothetical protein